MKSLHKILLATTILAIQTAAGAFPILLGSHHDNSVMTFNVITPNAKKIHLENGQIWAGTSMSAPCSDLMLMHEMVGASGYALNGTQHVSSKEIVDMVGVKVTCMREDAMYKGKNYSSGKIRLTWDTVSGEYTKASPSIITMDFTK